MKCPNCGHKTDSRICPDCKTFVLETGRTASEENRILIEEFEQRQNLKLSNGAIFVDDTVPEIHLSTLPEES